MDIRSRHFDPMKSEEWILQIAGNSFSKDELCWLYCCGLLHGDLLTDPENLLAVTKAMLESGMDPNQLITDRPPNEDPSENFYEIPLIAATRYPEDSAVAESLKLLLEAGGNPNTIYRFDDYEENVYDFYVEDEFANGPDLDGASFYGLLLCAAYGGKCKSGYNSFTMLIDAPVSIFKDYGLYWYEIERNKDHSSTLYVVEKETGKRVAKYH